MLDCTPENEPSFFHPKMMAVVQQRYNTTIYNRTCVVNQSCHTVNVAKKIRTHEWVWIKKFITHIWIKTKIFNTQVWIRKFMINMWMNIMIHNKYVNKVHNKCTNTKFITHTWIKCTILNTYMDKIHITHIWKYGESVTWHGESVASHTCRSHVTHVAKFTTHI